MLCSAVEVPEVLFSGDGDSLEKLEDELDVGSRELLGDSSSEPD